MKKQMTWLAGIAIIVVLMTSGLWGFLTLDRDEPPPVPMAPLEVVLGAELSLLTAPVWVAEHEGYFQQSGVNLELREFESGKASLSAMLAGEGLDISTAAQTPVMFNSFERDDFAIISAMVTSYTDMKIIARRDKGITSPSDIEGRKIGLTRGSTGEYFLSLALFNFGLATSSVEIVDINPLEIPRAIEDGRVDAISIWEPHALTAINSLGDNAMVLDTQNLYREDFYFIASREFLNASPDAARRFLEAIGKAQKFIADNPEEAKGIVSQRLELNAAQINALWDEFDFQLGIDQTTILSLESEARWAIKNALTESKLIPNYLDYIHEGPLEQLEPEAVRFIR